MITGAGVRCSAYPTSRSGSSQMRPSSNVRPVVHPVMPVSHFARSEACPKAERQHVVVARCAKCSHTRACHSPGHQAREVIQQTSEDNGNIVRGERAAPAARPRRRPRACSPGTRSSCRFQSRGRSATATLPSSSPRSSSYLRRTRLLLHLCCTLAAAAANPPSWHITLCLLSTMSMYASAQRQQSTVTALKDVLGSSGPGLHTAG